MGAIESDIDALKAQLAAADQARSVLHEKLEAAQEALKVYGQHLSTCNRWKDGRLYNGYDCTCGFPLAVPIPPITGRSR